ncbi:hypothetical protein AAC387_Pa05g3662 [Persea americana]
MDDQNRNFLPKCALFFFPSGRGLVVSIEKETAGGKRVFICLIPPFDGRDLAPLCVNYRLVPSSDAVTCESLSGFDRLGSSIISIGLELYLGVMGVGWKTYGKEKICMPILYVKVKLNLF